jgi:hypothetical protein
VSAVTKSPYGVASSMRMPTANRPPMKNMIEIDIRYMMAIRLWSFVSSQDFRLWPSCR